jgi:hypothetical protein
MNILPKDRMEVFKTNEILNFYGLITFYFQNMNNNLTKNCIRTATTIDIIRILIEK